MWVGMSQRGLPCNKPFHYLFFPAHGRTAFLGLFEVRCSSFSLNQGKVSGGPVIPRWKHLESNARFCGFSLPLTVIGRFGGKHPDMLRQCGRQVSGAMAESAESVREKASENMVFH